MNHSAIMKKRFFVSLLLWMGLVCVCVILAQQIKNEQLSFVLTSFFNVVYLFTPGLAILTIEKWCIKKIISEYSISLRKANVKHFISYILAVSLIFPALIILFSYILGNICGFESVGHTLAFNNSEYTLFGIYLPQNVFLRILCTVVGAFIITLLAGLTFNLFFALGNEIGWRGFLQKNIDMPNARKSIFIGSVWGVWNIPIILLSGDNVNNKLITIVLTIFWCIAFSFLLSKAFRQTESIITTAAMQGIVLSIPYSYFLVNGDHVLFGSYGLLAIVSIILVDLMFSRCRIRQTHNS